MATHFFLKPHLAAQYSFQSKLVDDTMAEELNSRQYELILLGATGYTGKLVAEWVSTHLPNDLRWAVAGRNAKKLQDVVDELKKLSPGRKQPDIETCELDKAQVDALVQKTKLVITTVGPFMHYGEPVLAACASHGTHYLDCTGEIPWIYDMVSKYDDLAKRNKSIIIPECGLDSVPADIMSYVLAREVRKRFNAACERVMLTLYDAKSGFSGGTSLTILELFEKYSLTHLAKSMHPYSLSPVGAKNVVAAPTGSLFYRLFGLLSIPELGGVQTTGLMASVDTCIAHRSWGLYSQTAEYADDATLSYGPRFRFTEYMRAKGLISALIIKLALGSMGLFLALPPTRWILAPLIKKFLIPAPGQGPSRESMKKDFLAYRGVGVAEDGKGKVTGKLDIAHGGYAATRTYGGGGGPDEGRGAVPLPVPPPHGEAVLRLQHPGVHAPPRRGRLPREPRPPRRGGRGGGVRGGEEAARGREAAGGGVLALHPQVQERDGVEGAVMDEGERCCALFFSSSSSPLLRICAFYVMMMQLELPCYHVC